MKIIFFFQISLGMAAILSSCGGGKGKLLLPDSSRWTDQDIPLEEIQTGSINTDSIVMLDKMRSAFAPSDTLISGRPVSFYLNRPDISNIARDFFLLNFIPSDNDATFALCDSILTVNDTTRPFYFFLFMRIMRISEGSLSEGISNYAAKYVLRYPDEFFKRIGEPMYKQYYNEWVSTVAYDFAIPGFEKPTSEDVRSYIIREQISHTKHIIRVLRSKIEKFADAVSKQE